MVSAYAEVVVILKISIPKLWISLVEGDEG